MRSRIALSVGLLFSLAIPAAAQRVVRFETTVGSFDMVLNPTNNPVLNDYADNLVKYVENNNYLGSWINRAAKNQDGTDFVLQMGGFFSNTKRPSPTMAAVQSVATFDPVIGHPAAETGLSNTVGTVALALPGSSSGTDRNAGTSSFFVNLGSNTFLDADFTVFATISDMTTINKIMALSTVDRTADPNFGAGNGNLGFSDVPVTTEGQQVFIKRAFLISDTLAVTQALAAVQPLVQSSLAAGSSSNALGGGSAALTTSGSGTSSTASDSSVSAAVVPEPASIAIAAVAALSYFASSRRRGR